MVTDSDFVYNLCRMGELNIFISTFFKLNRKTKHQQLGILLSVVFRGNRRSLSILQTMSML